MTVVNSFSDDNVLAHTPKPVTPDTDSGLKKSTGAAISAAALAPAQHTIDDLTDAAKGTVDAISVDKGIAKLNSDGDQIAMRLTAEAVAMVEIGGKAQIGSKLTVRQNGDGADANYTVTIDKHVLGAVKGQLPIPNLPLKAEVGAQTYDQVEMTFDTQEDAARATKILQSMVVADTFGDIGGTASGIDNPAANPVTASGFPDQAALDEKGVKDTDIAFLRDNISAYEQTATVRGRLALEAKLPQIASFFEASAEGRLDERRLVTRRVELPTDTQDGSLTYSVARDMRLSVKEKSALGLNVANQVVIGPMLQNRQEYGTGTTEVSATWNIPAGADVTESPISDRPVPEFDGVIDGAPDKISAQMDVEWRDQSPLTLARGDTNRSTVTLDINDPAKAPEAIGALIDGDPVEAARLADASLTREIQSIERTGVNLQGGAKVQVVDGVKVEGTLIFEAGIDDVVGTQRTVIKPAEETTDPTPVAAPPADPATPDAPIDNRVVMPRDGLNLRDTPDGDRVSVFQNGTFLEQTGDAVTGPDGQTWVPVRGTDLNDDMVEGFVAEQYIQPHDPDLGQMDANGRINPTLENERFQEVQVKDGDNLWDLAQEHGVDFSEMVALNKDHLVDPNLIFDGDTVYLPGTAQGPVPEPAAEPTPVASNSAEPKDTSSYQVEHEETGELNIDGTGSLVDPRFVPPGTTEVVESGVDSLSGAQSADGLSPTPPAAPTPPAEPPRPGQAANQPELGDILDEYQVPEAEMGVFRPDMTPEWTEDVATWANKNLDWVPGVGPLAERAANRAGTENGFSLEANVEEVKLLEQLGPIDQLTWANMSEKTSNDAYAAYAKPDGNTMPLGRWANDGHLDAYRHTLWNARMTQEFGEEWTAAYATAHEMVPGNPAAREAMDLFNNEVGRRIATENPDATDAELQQLVSEAVANGDTVVINQDGALVRSNEVAIGEHGRTPKTILPGHQEIVDEALRNNNTESN